MSIDSPSKLGRISVLIAVIAIGFVALVFASAIRGVATIGFHFLVYSVLGAGVLALFGGSAALVALRRREARRAMAYAGLALNLAVLAVAGCFTILV